MRQASSASCSGDATRPANLCSALSRPTVTAEEEPSPVPLEGISAIVVISTPEVIQVILMASRTSSCSRSSKSSTSSIDE